MVPLLTTFMSPLFGHRAEWWKAVVQSISLPPAQAIRPDFFFGGGGISAKTPPKKTRNFKGFCQSEESWPSTMFYTREKNATGSDRTCGCKRLNIKVFEKQRPVKRRIYGSAAMGCCQWPAEGATASNLLPCSRKWVGLALANSR